MPSEEDRRADFHRLSRDFQGIFKGFSWIFKALSSSRTPRRHVPEQEIVLAAMPLSAELRRATKLRLAIHPQFEAQHLRERVQER